MYIYQNVIRFIMKFLQKMAVRYTWKHFVYNLDVENPDEELSETKPSSSVLGEADNVKSGTANILHHLNSKNDNKELFSRTVTIQGIEYSIDTSEIRISENITPGIETELLKLTNLTGLRAYSALKIPGTLTNLTGLFANRAEKIPGTLINLTALSAENAKEIPGTLINLTGLLASRAEKIPETLTNLTILGANNAKEIPETLTNLTRLAARSAKEIPVELTKLRILSTNTSINIEDFPNLEKLNGEEIQRTR